MSSNLVHNALLNVFQKDSAIDTEFSQALTGTVSSSGTTVSGTGTAFITELKIDDYIGKPSKGYRKIISITDIDTLTVESAFDSDLSNEAIKKTEVKKGFAKNENLTEAGKILRIVFIASTDLEVEAARKLGVAIGSARILAVYGFVIAVGFYEPNDITAEERKGNYDKIIRDVIDKNMTVGSTIGINEMGRLLLAESPENQGIYFGTMPFTCYKMEICGNR